jgi:hypothetical protein
MEHSTYLVRILGDLHGHWSPGGACDLHGAINLPAVAMWSALGDLGCRLGTFLVKNCV